MTIDLGFIGLMHYLKDSQILGAMASYSRYSKDGMADKTRLPAILLQTCMPTIRHAPTKCNEEVFEARTVAVQQQDTQWCLRFWKDWSNIDYYCLLLNTYQYCKVFNGIWPSGSEFTMKPRGFTMGPGRFTMEPRRFTMEPGKFLS